MGEQPRVPAGSPDGGQFASAGGGAGGGARADLSGRVQRQINEAKRMGVDVIYGSDRGPDPAKLERDTVERAIIQAEEFTRSPILEDQTRERYQKDLKELKSYRDSLKQVKESGRDSPQAQHDRATAKRMKEAGVKVTRPDDPMRQPRAPRKGWSKNNPNRLGRQKK